MKAETKCRLAVGQYFEAMKRLSSKRYHPINFWIPSPGEIDNNLTPEELGMVYYLILKEVSKPIKKEKARYFNHRYQGTGNGTQRQLGGKKGRFQRD